MPEGQDLEISRPWPFGAAAQLRGHKGARQVFLFLIVGVSNTILNYGVYLALLQVVHYAWAYTGAFIVSLVFTGLMNIRVTFAHHPTVAAMSAFAAYYCLYYVCNLLLLHVFVEQLGIDDRFAPLVVLPIMVPIGFLTTRFIVRRFGRAQG